MEQIFEKTSPPHGANVEGDTFVEACILNYPILAKELLFLFFSMMLYQSPLTVYGHEQMIPRYVQCKNSLGGEKSSFSAFKSSHHFSGIFRYLPMYFMLYNVHPFIKNWKQILWKMYLSRFEKQFPSGQSVADWKLRNLSLYLRVHYQQIEFDMVNWRSFHIVAILCP